VRVQGITQRLSSQFVQADTTLYAKIGNVPIIIDGRLNIDDLCVFQLCPECRSEYDEIIAGPCRILQKMHVSEVVANSDDLLLGRVHVRVAPFLVILVIAGNKKYMLKQARYVVQERLVEFRERIPDVPTQDEIICTWLHALQQRVESFFVQVFRVYVTEELK
jgi:hypothetical protein